MNRFQAIILDKLGSYYEAYDEDTNLWCVFGSESGFCYFTYMSEEKATSMADELNRQNDLYNREYIKAAKQERRKKAEQKLSELAGNQPLISGVLAVGEGGIRKKSLWNRISSFFSGSVQN